MIVVFFGPLLTRYTLSPGSVGIQGQAPGWFRVLGVRGYLTPLYAMLLEGPRAHGLYKASQRLMQCLVGFGDVCKAKRG